MDKAHLETIRLRSESSWDFRRMQSFDGAQAAEDRRDLLAYIDDINKIVSALRQEADENWRARVLAENEAEQQWRYGS